MKLVIIFAASLAVALIGMLFITHGGPEYCRDRLHVNPPQGDIPYLEGAIDESFYSRFQTIITNSDSGWIAVKSHGGNEHIAVQIAQDIIDNDISIYIVDYCFSACMNYIIPAARQSFVSDGSVYGYHGGAYGLYSNGLVADEWIDQEQQRRSLINDTVNLYAQTNVDLNLLDMSVRMLEIPNIPGEPPFQGVYSAWIPSPQILAENDLCPAGDLVRSMSDAESRIEALGFSDEPWIYR